MTLHAINGGYKPTRTDLELEQQLKDILLRINDRESLETKSALWIKYQGLHLQRSPEYVAWLERQLGLR